MCTNHKIDYLVLPQFPDTSQLFMTEFSSKVVNHCEREVETGLAQAAASSSPHSSVRSRLSDHAASRVAKCIVVGDIAVGKTCLINRFGYDIFSNNYKATIGVDFDVQKFTILGVPFNLQVWDTAGQERFRCITSTYYRGASVALLVFDVTNLSSLDSVRRWRNEIFDSNPKSRPLLFLVGNKRDKLVSSSDSIPPTDPLSKPQPTHSTPLELVHKEAIKVAKELEAEYWTVSAQTGENISELFYRVASVTFNELVLREVEDLERERVGTSHISNGSDMNGILGYDGTARSKSQLEKYSNNNFIKLSSPRSGKRLSKEFKEPPRSCITINCVIK